MSPVEQGEILEIPLPLVFVELDAARERAAAGSSRGDTIDGAHAQRREMAEEDAPARIPLEEVRRVSDVDYQQRTIRGRSTSLARREANASFCLGDPGSGKSTLARYIALALLGGNERFTSPRLSCRVRFPSSSESAELHSAEVASIGMLRSSNSSIISGVRTGTIRLPHGQAGAANASVRSSSSSTVSMRFSEPRHA